MIIKIKNLKAKTILGVYDWEKQVKRPVIFNIKIDFDCSKVSKTNSLSDTIDYNKLSLKIIEHTESSSYELIETLLNEVVDIILSEELVKKCEVEIDKPAAVAMSDSVSLSQTSYK